MKRFRIGSLVSALALVAGVAFAQQAATPAPGPGMMGHGMMGQGMMGQGMMGQGMMGHGMMGQGMMGHGMMGQGMMGHGMMGQGMMDHGMMGPGVGRALSMLDLNDAQRKEVLKLHDEQRRKHWELAGKMHDEMAALRDAWWSDGKRDRAAVLAAHKRIGELRQQALESRLDAADRLDQVLTAEQREQFRRLGSRWMLEGAQ